MIFVTGGTGFLGHHLVPMLSCAGYPMRILTRHPEQHTWLNRYPYVSMIKGDLTTGEGLDAVAGCDYVIHAAGLFSMWALAGDFEATNIAGTQRLLDAAYAANVRRFVHVSTIAVIGNPQPDRIIDETHPPRPADAYQASKLHAERHVRAAYETQHLETIILRPGAFYGPLGDYAFNRIFFTDPLRGLIVLPDGGQYLTFPVYLPDVATSIIAALTQGQAGATYHICGESITHRAVYDIVCDLAGLRYPRIYLPSALGIMGASLLTTLSRVTQREPFYPLGMRSYVFNDWHVSTAKAQRDLGFVPTDFRVGAARTLAWYREGKPDRLPEYAC